MSAFLGPIHYWLYNKIQLQQEIVDEIYAIGDKYGLSLEKECNSRYDYSPDKPLEEMIDHGNIHGWLQERVSQVEYKYAYCVTELFKKDPETMKSLLDVMKMKGANLAIILKEYLLNAEGIFKAVTDNLLDGMPCDHANRVIKQSENEVIWERATCVHQNYWDEVGGDIKVYYELRDAWLDSLVKELGYAFEKVDEKTYRIYSVE